ncbi:MAG: flagellar biosynthesis protein FlhF [Peptococcaceae bacterium]|nr:flagellar biosynthesis protein FlhF [Peptococcaceae bacterium]
MKIKRYVVREMQEAIRLIKQDLGPEAVIVSSYKVTSTKGLLGLFSPRLFEVTAVLDDNEDFKINKALPGTGAPQIHQPTGTGGTENGKKQINTLIGNAVALLTGRQEEQKDMLKEYPSNEQQEKTLVEPLAKNLQIKDRIFSHTGNKGRFDLMVAKHMEAEASGGVLMWRKALLDMEVQENIVDRILPLGEKEQHLQDTEGQNFHMDVFKQITTLLEPAYCPAKQTRIKTFIGPAGVGKTTTLAKLATRFSLDDKKVAIVTVNTYRIGAVEQLQAYGNLLDVPVEVVMTPGQLTEVVTRHCDKDYILIDTAGRSAGNVGQILELKGFLDAVAAPQDIFLVLNLTTRNRDLHRIAHKFMIANYSKLVFTKIDETETHGAILNLVHTLGRPVAYLAYGQGVPDDISAAGPQKIAELLVRGVDPDEIMAI